MLYRTIFASALALNWLYRVSNVTKLPLYLHSFVSWRCVLEFRKLFFACKALLVAYFYRATFFNRCVFVSLYDWSLFHPLPFWPRKLNHTAHKLFWICMWQFKLAQIIRPLINLIVFVTYFKYFWPCNFKKLYLCCYLQFYIKLYLIRKGNN